jgi:potassium-dependent mechanosensitive channel
MDQGLKESLAAFDSVWRLKLITIAGIKLSLGNVTVALILLVFATRLSRLAVKLINKKLILRFVEDKASQTTYQTFAFYGCLTLFVTLSLTIAGIPLTVFTVVGGALAIGVGFGSQNIVNNFISGVIMLVEQPIKVGDVVEVDGIVGSVLSIGTRSTKIRNADHKVFIVPNSFFLEKGVLNWNFETTIIRSTLDFGVAYGTDTRLVENACMDILLNTEGIEQSPLPYVFFTDFAESNLTFQLVFFCDTVKVESLAHVRSHVRFKIDQKFKELGIEMAFPQRDLRLKMDKTINVRLKS